MRFRLRTLMIVVTVVALGMAFLREVIDRTAIETAENVKRVSWLPPTASSISYYRSSSFALYEFDMSESDFLKWSRWRVEPISSVPAIVMRYGCETLPHFFDPAIEEQEEWEAQRFATVTNGLSYRTNNPNGRGVIVAYDRSKGRAFIHDASRNRLRTLLIVLSLGLIAGLCSIVYLGWARSQGVVGTDSAVRYEIERARKAASFDPDIQANRNDEWEERMKETKASSD